VKLSNIPLSKFKKFLKDQGCKHIGGRGGHLKYTRKDLQRPIVIQSHIDPVPVRIIGQVLRAMKMSNKKFLEVISNKKSKS